MDRAGHDHREANEFLLRELGPEVYHDLRFKRGKISMHDAELILRRNRR
ncbi:MAG: hypothetical protein PHW53_01995 [Patescibacteria group bacterium]|nr:hypothetical protein [Patescibacteria group bacterium]